MQDLLNNAKRLYGEKKMAKLVTNLPEPKMEYDVQNQRLINLSIKQIVEKLNFSYQQDIKNEQNTFNWFIS